MCYRENKGGGYRGCKFRVIKLRKVLRESDIGLEIRRK